MEKETAQTETPRSEAPAARTSSPVSWRHNPYEASTPSPVTDSASANLRLSPRVSVRSRTGSIVVNGVPEYSLSNNEVTDGPSIKVCTRNGIAGNGSRYNEGRRSHFVTPSDASDRRYSLGDSNGRGEYEEVIDGSRSPAFSVYEDPLEMYRHEQQQQQQYAQSYSDSAPRHNHLHNMHHGLTRSRASSIQSLPVIFATQRLSDNPGTGSFSTSASLPVFQANNHFYHYDMCQESYSALSTPSMSGSFAGAQDFLGPSRTLIGCNSLACEDGAVHRSLYNYDAESTTSYRSTVDNFTSPMPLSGEFFGRPPSFSRHAVGNTNVGPFTSWGLVNVRISTSQSKEELESCDSADDSRGFQLDDELEVEAYNTTLRPNEVKLQNANNNNKNTNKDKKTMKEEQRIISNTTPTKSVQSENEKQHVVEKAQDSPNHLAPNKINAQGDFATPQESHLISTQPHTIDWKSLEHSMMQDTSKEVMCPPGSFFSVYDAEIRNHYSIESAEIVATRGAVEYLKLNESRGTQTRCRFQLCKRYLNKRCGQGANCQYIHTHSIPSPTFIHINENVVTAAVVEGREMPPEVLRGGKNNHGYPTMPPGVMFSVFPPNQGKSVSQLIPSEMILRTVGSTNIYGVLVNSGSNKTREACATETVDTSSSDNGNLNNIKARHCAHFQFNKMCNLGESCNFIHSLVPYVQRLSMPPQSPPYHSMMSSQPFVIPQDSMSHFTQFPNGTKDNHTNKSAGGVMPSYPVDLMQPPSLQMPHHHHHHPPPPPPAAAAATPHLLQLPQESNHLMYQRNMPMMSVPFYMPPPVSSTWDGSRYGP